MIYGQFNDSFTPMVDGVVNVVKNYATCLNKDGNRAIVVTPEMPHYYDIEDYPVERYFSIPLKSREPYRIGLDVVDASFHRRLRCIPFDLVHAHCPFSSGILAQQVAKTRGIPVVGTFHTKYYDDFKESMKVDLMARIGSRVVAEFYRRCDEVWAVSADAAATLREYGYKGSIEVVANGTDFTATPASPEAQTKMLQLTGLQSDELVLLFVGRMVWQKNLEMMMAALALARKQLPFKMVFAGDGNALEPLKQKAEALGLSSSMLFLGMVPDRTVLKALFERADLLLFPSVYDTSGLVVKEAAASGTPSLVISGAAPAEGINDGWNGYLASNNAASYAEAIVKAASNRHHLAASGKQASSSLYRNWESIVAEVKDRYDGLIRIRKNKVASL